MEFVSFIIVKQAIEHSHCNARIFKVFTVLETKDRKNN